MYCEYFGFEREPFSISPDPAFLYPSEQHRQALAHLQYGLGREGGFMLLTGEVGTGKTTICRLFIEQIPATTRVAYVLNAQLDADDLLASICQELHIETAEGSTRRQVIDALSRDLLQAHAQGRKTLVIVEEAQNLSFEALEMLRLLTNLETSSSKLLHILLVGQPELLERIGQPALRQLNQRIISRFHLDALDREESANYLLYRMSKAGGRRQLFSPAAVRELHRRSGGIPRLLNLLAERSLLGAYATEQEQVSRAIVKRASAEVAGLSHARPQGGASRHWGMVVIGVPVIGLVLLFGWQYPLRQTSGPVEVLAMTDAPLIGVGLAARSATDLSAVPPGVNETPVMGVATEAVNEPAAEAAVSLLRVWQVELETAVDNLCAQAQLHRLQCAELNGSDLAGLELLNRPGLVTLAGDLDQLERYLLLALEVDTSMLLANASGELRLAPEDFMRRWQGDYQYLWKPPAGYQRELRPGDINWAVVSWLAERLNRLTPSVTIIAAGHYSEPLVAGVRDFQAASGLEVDGILGMRTIMKLNERFEHVPRLVQSRVEVH